VGQEAGHFDICGPLPGPGVTILEASAGTGKTFTIAALVARLVAEEEVPLSEILAVTFTRMATGELRDRIRERLVTAERGLSRLLDAGEQPAADDDVLQLIARGSTSVVEVRRQRLAAALAGFDAATITTTHGFCHMVLAALGVWGEVAAGATLLEDPTDLVEEVVDDLFVRHVVRSGPLPFRRRQALEAGISAIQAPDAPLEPPAAKADTTPAGLRRRLCAAAREEVRRRLLDDNLLTYDDLLLRLANALDDDERGPTACQRLRGRYRVVLVDEFQDTDPLQWRIVRHAFADGDTRLVLIGDPKQAVYSFRGADVYAYLEAARAAQPDRRFTLEQNWRSDAGLLEAYDALLSPLHLGHPEIVYRRAYATAAHRQPGLQDAPVPSPLRLRLVPNSTPGLERTSGTGLLQKDRAVKYVAEDLAADVVALLSSGAKLVNWRAEGSPEQPPKDVRPSDIGVLVRTNRQASIVQASLLSAGVPVVVAGALSVLSTPAARDWLRLLEALEQPSSRSLAVAAALTPFFGMSARDLAEAHEKTWEGLHARLHQWAALLRRTGVAALFDHIRVTERLPARLLSEVDGERLLTDLGHVGELLYAESTQAQLGLAALRGWLARRISEASEVSGDAAEVEQYSRRLDSDSEAVEILTVHRAKGLEFPVVYCPYLWDSAVRTNKGGPVVFHDPDDHDQRKLDVGGDPEDPLYWRHYRANQAEERGEDLRHLYVALTRAKHQVVIWWAGANGSQYSALGRLLLARGSVGDVKAEMKASEVKDARVEAELVRRSALAPNLISVEHCGRGANAAGGLAGTSGNQAELRAARFDRQLDLGWRRSSYTSITAAAHGGGAEDLVSSEPEQPGTSDEPVAKAAVLTPPVMAPGPDGVAQDEALADEALADESAADESGGADWAGAADDGVGADERGGRRDDERRARGTTSLLSEMPAGAAFGTFVHSVLENVDFAAPDLRSELLQALEIEGARSADGVAGEAAQLVSGLEVALSAPLGGPAGPTRLRDVSRADRLDELAFELPLAGGDKPTGEVLLTDLAELLARHIRPGERLAAYANDLLRPQLANSLRGYLIGSLDLVFRVRSDKSASRFYVVDYKTNWLGAAGDTLTAWHYRGPALEAEMRRAHYPLQAMFYLVALHRYLRWRLPGYNAGTNLGGAYYLFLRGMACPGAPTVDGEPCGVFAWAPPVELITGLSDLLAGEGTRAATIRTTRTVR
jgi:exodeoxyribonuclease V beta subunit